MAQSTGKIFGGVAGFLLGGPVGAILGVFAGSWFDKNMALEDGGSRYYNPETVFWTGVSVLSAKMSKADGTVSQDEVELFRRFLNQQNVDQSTQKLCAEIFNKAKVDAQGYDVYAEDIFEIWHHDSNVLGEIFILLVNIAKSDNYLHPEEMRMLERIAQIFRIHPQDFQRFMALAEDKVDEHIYDILGVKPDAFLSEIKRAYRKLVKENHPDTLESKGVPQHVIDDAKERMAKINEAYDKILKEREKR